MAKVSGITTGGAKTSVGKFSSPVLRKLAQEATSLLAWGQEEELGVLSHASEDRLSTYAFG